VPWGLSLAGGKLVHINRGSHWRATVMLAMLGARGISYRNTEGLHWQLAQTDCPLTGTLPNVPIALSSTEMYCTCFTTRLRKKLSEHEKALKEFKCLLCKDTLAQPISTPCGRWCMRMLCMPAGMVSSSAVLLSSFLSQPARHVSTAELVDDAYAVVAVS
jgi:hypothetical protein